MAKDFSKLELIPSVKRNPYLDRQYTRKWEQKMADLRKIKRDKAIKLYVFKEFEHDLPSAELLYENRIYEIQAAMDNAPDEDNLPAIQDICEDSPYYQALAEIVSANKCKTSTTELIATATKDLQSIEHFIKVFAAHPTLSNVKHEISENTERLETFKGYDDTYANNEKSYLGERSTILSHLLRLQTGLVRLPVEHLR